MRLNDAQTQQVQQQLGLNALSDEHPVIPKLQEAFGDHTFFLNERGLNIIEPNPAPEVSGGNLVELAAWADDGQGLWSHPPEVLPVQVDIEVDGSGSERH